LPPDIERAWEALKTPPVRAFTSSLRPPTFICNTNYVSLAINAWRRRGTQSDLLNRFCDDVEFSPEDATRTDTDFLCKVLEAVVEAGATTLNIPDTVGYTVPAEFGELIATIRRRVRGIEKVTIRRLS